MNTLRGISFIVNPLIDESKSAAFGSQLIPCASFNDGNDLSKNLFYACGICEGSLVPVAICTICKKTEIRRCTKCEIPRKMDSHEACKTLVSFGSEITKKYTKD
ncbi:MAG TPA: hypothetical protein VMW55_08640 [Nitrosopumilaceae archaeon]|jgi:hypothetical protein|nr:hypothetical protein [Nitrosopumilaceae archaeon]